MKRILSILSLSLIGTCLLAQNQMSLDGTWEIIYDDENKGVEGAWQLNKHYDAQPGIKEITVPSCWEEYEKNYEGVAFYRKKFTLPAQWEGKILDLTFDASNYLTQIWLNEQNGIVGVFGQLGPQATEMCCHSQNRKKPFQFPE